MVDFMVLAGPRSATTWIANLLCTDTSHCAHDPMSEYTPAQLDRIGIPGKRFGISCTNAMLFPEWVRDHRAKKVFLYRDLEEINTSLVKLGLHPLVRDEHLKRIKELPPKIAVFQWNQVFKANSAAEICRILGVPFCPYRFQELVRMNIQPQWSRVPADPEAVKALMARIREAAK